MEQLETEVAARRTQQRLVAMEADVAPGVEIEVGDRRRQRRTVSSNGAAARSRARLTTSL